MPQGKNKPENKEKRKRAKSTKTAVGSTLAADYIWNGTSGGYWSSADWNSGEAWHPAAAGRRSSGVELEMAGDDFGFGYVVCKQWVAEGDF